MSAVSRDVIVVGGGPVGLLLAALLGQAGHHDVLVLDARESFALPAGVDPRVYALSRAGQRLLQRCGAWQALSPEYAWPYRRMHVWDAAGPHVAARALVFDAAELAEPDLGHIVENARLEHALRAAALACARVELRPGTRVEALEISPQGACVVTAGGERLHARLVIAADGARSRLRELAGIEIRSRDYRQSALVTHVHTEYPHEHTAWQRFLPTGPVALLPLGDGRSSVVWSAEAPLAERLMQLDDAAFCAELGEATDFVLGRMSGPEARHLLPLMLLHARSYTARRLALVGDAAHVVHPLAGQGVNLGLLDAACLAECLDHPGDPGERRRLRRYERMRKADNTAMVSALDGLQRVFGIDRQPVAGLRVAGLGLVNRLPALKRGLMRRALGA
jgi:2-polyprenylphenol 6-hydroxylase